LKTLNLNFRGNINVTADANNNNLNADNKPLIDGVKNKFNFNDNENRNEDFNILINSKIQAKHNNIISDKYANTNVKEIISQISQKIIKTKDEDINASPN